VLQRGNVFFLIKILSSFWIVIQLTSGVWKTCFDFPLWVTIFLWTNNINIKLIERFKKCWTYLVSFPFWYCSLLKFNVVFYPHFIVLIRYKHYLWSIHNVFFLLFWCFWCWLSYKQNIRRTNKEWMKWMKRRKKKKNQENWFDERKLNFWNELSFFS
jgi:hypothetical protein